MNLIPFLQKLSAVRLWLISIGISILMSEIIVCGMEILLKGEITYDFLLTGFVTSLCVAGIIVAGLTYFLDQQRLAAEELEQRVAEEVAKNMAQERLLIQQSRLAALGEMIGNIAHQWRQPLNALGLSLQNIKDAYEFGELDQEYLHKSTAAGMQLIAKMSATIDNFRNFFKPSREKTAFSLEQSMNDTLSILSAGFKSHNVTVHLDADEDVVAYGFPNEYSQVLLNIFSNARDAMLAKNRENGEIHVRIARVGDQARIAVRDNAGGIPADILAKIFDPYFTTKEKSSGIGLYMSKMIIEDNMNGKIEARNVEGGAEFVVTCPVPT
jgi:signal transduction histidine kinase